MTFQTMSGHFWISFPNGYILSIFNGYGFDTNNQFDNDYEKEIWKSNLVEIAILRNHEFFTKKFINSDDDVKTVDLKELIDIINILNNF